MTEQVEIDYTNWRGVRAKRIIIPTGRIIFEFNRWHPKKQWLIEAVDDRTIKLFAMQSIHSWKQL